MVYSDVHSEDISKTHKSFHLQVVSKLVSDINEKNYFIIMILNLKAPQIWGIPSHAVSVHKIQAVMAAKK